MNKKNFMQVNCCYLMKFDKQLLRFIWILIGFFSLFFDKTESTKEHFMHWNFRLFFVFFFVLDKNHKIDYKVISSLIIEF